MVKEMKKRTATALYFDVSYKEAKRLDQYKGASALKGLARGTNSFSEVHLQFHIATDLHDQMESAISACKNSYASFGHALSKLVFTNDPYRDKSFFYNIFPTMQDNNFITTNDNISNEHASRDINSSNAQTTPTLFSIDNYICSSNYDVISSVSSSIKEQVQ